MYPETGLCNTFYGLVVSVLFLPTSYTISENQGDEVILQIQRKFCTDVNVEEFIPMAVHDIMSYHNVSIYHLFHQGVFPPWYFLPNNIYKGTDFHVDALNGTSINEIVKVTLGSNMVAIILDAGKKNKDVYKQIQSQQDLMNNKMIIAIGGNTTDWTSIARFGEKLIMIDPSEVTCSKPEGDADPIRISLHYFSSEAESVEYGGYWSSSKGLHFIRRDLWTFNKFRNKFFRVTSLNVSDKGILFGDTDNEIKFRGFKTRIHHYYKVDEKGTKHWDGITIRVLQALAEALNFTYTLYETPDRKWGGINPDKSWNGLVGEVMYGHADIAAAAMTINSDRETVIDYGQPFYMDPSVMIMRRPNEDRLLMFAWPLSFFVWLCMFLSILVVSTTVFLSTCLHDNLSCDRRNMPHFYSLFQDGFTMAYSSAFRQSLPWLPNFLSVRVVFSIWWFIVIIMSAIYTGNLTAVLTVPRSPSPIDTLQQLADQDVYKAGVVESAALHLLFSSPNNSAVYKHLYENSMQYPENLVQTTEEGMQRAKEENYVFICEKTEAIHYVYSDCGYVMGKEEFYTSSYAFMFPENSPYIPVFNRKLMQLDDSGLLEYWTLKQLPRNKCAFNRDNQSGDRIATMSDLHGAFVILCAGTFASVLILFSEWFMVSVVSNPWWI